MRDVKPYVKVKPYVNFRPYMKAGYGTMVTRQPTPTNASADSSRVAALIQDDCSSPPADFTTPTSAIANYSSAGCSIRDDVRTPAADFTTASKRMRPPSGVSTSAATPRDSQPDTLDSWRKARMSGLGLCACHSALSAADSSPARGCEIRDWRLGLGP